MRKVMVLIAFLVSVVSFAQKITVNEIDKFTHQKRLQTSTSLLKSSLAGYIGSYIRVVDTTIFINLKGSDFAATVVGKDDKAIFLLDDGNTVTVYSPSIQDYEVYNGTLGVSKIYDHQYLISQADLTTLSKHTVSSIRVYGVDGYIDTEVPKKNQNAIGKLAATILKEL